RQPAARSLQPDDDARRRLRRNRKHARHAEVRDAVEPGAAREIELRVIALARHLGQWQRPRLLEDDAEQDRVPVDAAPVAGGGGVYLFPTRKTLPSREKQNTK